MERVQILLSTYNGEKYLKEQIESILNQQNIEISLLIRDDGSSDKTIEILEELAKRKNIKYYQGKNVGPAKSFMDLISKADETFSYYAFADQDDVWQNNKIINAINKMKNTENMPTLYMSALEVVDKNLNTINIKKVEGNFCFEGELIKNFATGCSMVFNKKLLELIKKYNPEYIIMHDSWVTRVAYAIGANVIIDENAYIKYRQHENNVLGYKDSKIKKLEKQFKIAFMEKTAMREKIAQELKNGYYDLLTENSKQIIDNLIKYRTNKKAKKWLLKNKNFRTNDSKINFKMKLAIILNRF